MPAERVRVSSATFFWGDQWSPLRIGGQMGGDAWSGHVSWPISLGRWTMRCCCGTSIWLLKTGSVSYTHLRAHETGRNLVCRLLLEKKKKNNKQKKKKKKNKKNTNKKKNTIIKK